MKKWLLVLVIVLPFFTRAQPGGIHFEKSLNWDQIKAKAKTEKKYIFVDCYATWCTPCKEMDKIYDLDSIGQTINPRYVSVKLQMDSSKDDDSYIRSFYPIARQFEKKYKISELPFYLFFAPDGSVLHKGTGRKNSKNFIAMIDDVINPDKQFYTLITKVSSGEIFFKNMPAVVNQLKHYQEDSLALLLAKQYMSGYLDFLQEDEFRKKTNLEFILYNPRIITSNTRVFRLILNEPEVIDSLWSYKGYSRSLLKSIIFREEIHPKLEIITGKHDPDWKLIQSDIDKKYSKGISHLSIIDAKINWYREKQQWDAYLNSIRDKWVKFPWEIKNAGWMGLNDLAWVVCIHSNKKNDLELALEWIDIALMAETKFNSAMTDTKATILYKLGKKDDAVEFETRIAADLRKKIVNSKNENERINNERTLTSIENVIKQMRSGIYSPQD